MTCPFIVVIPMVPARELSPNRRAHWAVRNEAAQALRMAAKAATVIALDGAPVWSGIYGDAFDLDMQVFWPKGRKRMDVDNAVASCKAAIDGIADALGIDDRHLGELRIRQGRDPAGDGWIAATVTVRATNAQPSDDKPPTVAPRSRKKA